MNKLLKQLVSNSFPDGNIQAVSPGRVNLLGEHVDTNGGIVLPAAIDRHVVINAKSRNDRVVVLQALDMEDRVQFSLDS